jgi:periplasmic protein CpxP/Spy
MSMKKFTLTAVSTAICALSIAATAIAPSFAQQQPTGKAAPALNNDRAQTIEQLKLSNEQKTKLAQLEQSTRQKMIGILTPKQKEQVRLDVQQGKSSKLTLTLDQQNQLRAIQTSVLAQRDAILTPEQKQKLQQLTKQNTPQR